MGVMDIWTETSIGHTKRHQESSPTSMKLGKHLQPRLHERPWELKKCCQILQIAWLDHTCPLHQKNSTSSFISTYLHTLETTSWCGLAQERVEIAECGSSGVYFVTTNRCSRFRMPTDAAAFSSYSDHSPSLRSMSANFVPVNCTQEEKNHYGWKSHNWAVAHYTTSTSHNILNKKYAQELLLLRYNRFSYELYPKARVCKWHVFTCWYVKTLQRLGLLYSYSFSNPTISERKLGRLNASAVKASYWNKFAAFAVLQSIGFVPSGNHCHVSHFVTELALHRVHKNRNTRSN